MNERSDREVFTIDFGCILVPDNCWDFYVDGTMVPGSRRKFLTEIEEFTGKNRSVKSLIYYEKNAAEEIASILQDRVERVLKEQARSNRTEEQKQADWLEGERKEAREFNAIGKDLRAWDNDSDENRPSINWRELELYS